jgi:hypothetical protein
MSAKMTPPRHALTSLAALCALAALSPLSTHRAATATPPTAAEVAMMRAKAGEAERVARERIEMLFGRLCPGRCELLEVRAQSSLPTPVGRVLPGFDAPVASEVALSSVEAKVMLDSSLPRAFRSSLPQMIQHRLSDLSARVLVTPIQLEFPKPQLPPSPPLMPEAPPRAPEPAPPPEASPTPPEAPTQPPLEPSATQGAAGGEGEGPWEGWATLALLLALLLGITLAFLALWARLKELKGRLDDQLLGAAPAGGEEAAPELPDLNALRARLNASREVRNAALRAWLKEDMAELATLTRLLGAGVFSDLKRDPTLTAQLEALSEVVGRQRTPVTPESAWRVAHALDARLTAAEVTHTEGALSATWAFVQGVDAPALHALFGTLAHAEQSHLLGHLPAYTRADLLARLSGEERRDLALNASGARPLSRGESIDLAHRLKRQYDELGGVSEEMDTQAALVVDMLTSLPFAAQVDLLGPLSERRPDLTRAVLSTLCLEGTLFEVPSYLLTDVLIRTPFEDALELMRGFPEAQSGALISALPEAQRALYLEELELGRRATAEGFMRARAPFLRAVGEAARRAGIDLADLNLNALRRAAV